MLETPNHGSADSDADRQPYQFDALDRLILETARVDDPVELRRNELRGWSEAAGFVEVDVRNLGQPDLWEMRFNRGTNPDCNTAAEVDRWFSDLADEHDCQIAPDQFVAIVDGDRIAARFRLQPRPDAV